MEKSDENIDASVKKFQSPVPLLINLKNLIFGKEKPDVYTQLTFYINIIIWLTFLLWSILSYFTISSHKVMNQFKGINIERIIQKRGEELGFEGTDTFLDRLLTFNGVAIICWGIVFFGLILLFRKKSKAIYFILGGTFFYIGMSIFYLSWSYFIEDMTSYDKVALLIIIVSTIFHTQMIKQSSEGDPVNFFEPDQVEE